MGAFRLQERTFNISFMDLAKNGKIYLAILGITTGCWDFSIKWLMISFLARCQVLNTLLGFSWKHFLFLGVCVFGPRFYYNTFLASNRRIG